jgi:carbonic anhydrase
MIFRLTRKTSGLAMAICFVLAPAISRAQESHVPHWSYEGKEDPQHWGSLDPSFATCKMGHNQSPIDISHPTLADLPELKFDYKAVPLSITLTQMATLLSWPSCSGLVIPILSWKLSGRTFRQRKTKPLRFLRSP